MEFVANKMNTERGWSFVCGGMGQGNFVGNVFCEGKGKRKVYIELNFIFFTQKFLLK